MRHRPTLIIMVKEPRPGRVKTRLAAGIGTIPATWWFRHTVRGLLRRLDRDPRWKTVLSVAPNPAVVARCWPAQIPRIPQGAGDLGARMLRALAATGPGPRVLIGGDIPDVRPAHIARAFRALGTAELVFGPAGDGGFWLVGARNDLALNAGFMENIRWSHAETLNDTVKSATGRIAFVDTLDDVDTAADIARVGAPP